MTTVNLCHTGTNGKAHLFAREMGNSGTAAAIRTKSAKQKAADRL